MQSKKRDIVCAALLAVIVGHLAISQAFIPAWWSLGLQGCAANHEDCNTCSETELLNEMQQKLCSDHGETELIRAISKGTLGCIRNCQEKFSTSQWNCTTFHGDHLFGIFAENATRETAILNAFLSAGAVKGIAEACRENIIEGCTCDRELTERIDGITYLQECGEDVDFAISFLKDFYGLENSTCERDLVDKWNNECGYSACRNLSRYCRCAGLSGGCNVQICYDKAPSKEEIGCKLRSKYEGSQKVYGFEGNLYKTGLMARPPIPNFPCHINDSPNLCHASPELGILGTSGRKCNPASSGSDGCNLLCCNGFHEYHYTVDIETCKFVWCCRIECTITDTVNITDYICD